VPIADLNDAKDLDDGNERHLLARVNDDTTRRLQEIFVERLDFHAAIGTLALAGSDLPAVAKTRRERDGVQVVSVELLRAGRVTGSDPSSNNLVVRLLAFRTPDSTFTPSSLGR